MQITVTAPEHPVSQLREIFRQQIGCALRELEAPDDEVPASVHGARKQLKKARATLRLLRTSLGDEIYRRENIIVRDIARPLSGMRDAEILLATFDKLTNKQAKHEDDADAHSLHRALNAYVRILGASHSVSSEQIGQLRKTLNAARLRASRWELHCDDWDHVCLGLTRIYRKGRAQYKASREAPTTTQLHAWRKRAKYLWHQFQILTPIAPGELGELADQFHLLSDYLGEEHDLAVLEETIPAVQLEVRARTRAWFVQAAEERRTELREKAFALGERLYEQKPKRFSARMDTLWCKFSASPTTGS